MTTTQTQTMTAASPAIDTTIEALQLLQKKASIEAAMRKPGGIRVTQELELHAVRERLQHYPDAVEAILQVADALHRHVDTLSIDEVRDRTR
jgi:Arc/MetJ family transcription regulator